MVVTQRIISEIEKFIFKKQKKLNVFNILLLFDRDLVQLIFHVHTYTQDNLRIFFRNKNTNNNSLADELMKIYLELHSIRFKI